MTFYIDKECDIEFPFDIDEVAKLVIEKALSYVECPYDTEVNLLITDNEGIKEYNKIRSKKFEIMKKQWRIRGFPF